MSKFKLEVDDIRKSRNGTAVYHIIQVSENAVRCFNNWWTLKPVTLDKKCFGEQKNTLVNQAMKLMEKAKSKRHDKD